MIDANIRHEAVPVPLASCPFTQDQQQVFEEGLRLLIDGDDLPYGYGVTAKELGNDGFDELEEIGVGLRHKGYSAHLAWKIWQPRTEAWVKGLYVMNTLLPMRRSQ